MYKIQIEPTASVILPMNLPRYWVQSHLDPGCGRGECEDAARAYLYFSLPMLAAVRPASPTSGSSSSSSS